MEQNPIYAIKNCESYEQYLKVCPTFWYIMEHFKANRIHNNIYDILCTKEGTDLEDYFTFTYVPAVLKIAKAYHIILVTSGLDFFLRYVYLESTTQHSYKYVMKLGLTSSQLDTAIKVLRYQDIKLNTKGNFPFSLNDQKIWNFSSKERSREDTFIDDMVSNVFDAINGSDLVKEENVWSEYLGEAYGHKHKERVDFRKILPCEEFRDPEYLLEISIGMDLL